MDLTAGFLGCTSLFEFRKGNMGSINCLNTLNIWRLQFISQKDSIIYSQFISTHIKSECLFQSLICHSQNMNKIYLNFILLINILESLKRGCLQLCNQKQTCNKNTLNNIYNITEQKQMYYVSQQSLKNMIPQKTLLSVIVSTLTTPPNQRNNQDHELVFRFFQDNKILSEIQRVKSLNARQQCIANLQISAKKPDPSQNSMMIIDRLILEKDDEQEEKQKYYVLLDEELKNSIMNTDEKYLRKNIQSLKSFMILKDMKYSQMLHLAYYMDQISFKYKEDVYKQGDAVDYLYLVEKGQFHYAKSFISDQPTQPRKKKDRPKRYDAYSDNPNRIKSSVSKQMKIGVIQGYSGQSFGQDQILNEKPRQYSVKCMSTQNLVLRIPQDKYKNVIKSSMIKMQWLKKQNLKKLQLKGQLFSKMLSVKHNYKQLAEIISKNEMNKTQDLRINNGNQIIILEGNPGRISLLPKIRSHSMTSDEYSPKYSQKSIEKSHAIQQQSLKKSQKTEQNDDQGTFALTKAKYKNRVRKQRQNVTFHSPLNTNASNSSLLPSIGSEKSKAFSIHQTIDSNINKIWNGSRPILELRGLKKKFSGMIDSNSLIKQKEQILKVKIGKQSREQIFPFELGQKKSTIRQPVPALSKQQIRQMRSAAHSKVFMQKLLVEALKKAGYNAETDQSENSGHSSAIDIKNNLRVPKPKIKKQKQRSDSSFHLQNNAFDQCYFKKLS